MTDNEPLVDPTMKKPSLLEKLGFFVLALLSPSIAAGAPTHSPALTVVVIGLAKRKPHTKSVCNACNAGLSELE